MNPTILASCISSLAALIVCMVNNHFQNKRIEKANQENIVLISYRLEQLEKKVDKHNNMIERTYSLERRADVMEEKMSVVNHRIADIERHENDGK